MKKISIMLLLSAFTFGAMAITPMQQDTLTNQQDTTKKHKKNHKKGKGDKMKKDTSKWNKNKDTFKTSTLDTARKGSL